MIKIVKVTNPDNSTGSGIISISILNDAAVMINHYKTASSYTFDFSQFKNSFDGSFLHYNESTKTYSTFPWGDDTLLDAHIATALKIGSDNFIFIYCSTTETLDCGSVSIDECHNVITYLRTIPGVDFKFKKRDIKFETITSKVDAHSSIATLEAQVDYLTEIIQLLVLNDVNICNKYGEDLKAMLAVGNINNSNTPATIVAEKTRLRALQADYFAKRAEILSGN